MGSGDAGSADQGVDLSAAHHSHDFSKAHAADRVQADSHEAKTENNQVLPQEGTTCHGRTDGEPRNRVTTWQSRFQMPW